MSYRPFTDVWILARPKSKYFGAYPAGFLRRARDLIGCSHEDQVLHVCSGDIQGYKCGPGCRGNQGHKHGWGKNDLTMDLDVTLKADYKGDARKLSAYQAVINSSPQVQGVLADPPYSELFAMSYKVGPGVLPSTNDIVKHSLAILPVGGRVGILSMHWPRYPKAVARQIALVGVYVGNGNIGRTYAVYERIA
jgi:hypothetical protein